MSRFLKIGKWLAVGLVLVIALGLGARIFEAATSDPLPPWLTYVPDEPGPAAIDAMDWAAWTTAEAALFEAVRRNVSEQLEPEYRNRENRFYDGSPIFAGWFDTPWNRSFVLLPEGRPTGAVVLLHGLTDAPYSLRHVAGAYRDRGFVAVAVRMPGHGTVPAGLTTADWRDWMAATRLGVRAARAMTGPDVPLHLVGYSNGGALAVKYAMDALEDPALDRPARLVLMSPMVGVTWFARFAGLAGWPAVVPVLQRAAWFDIAPEFNPFKYNSFPVNGGRQSHRLTAALQAQIERQSRAGMFADMPPILSFQSVVDFTVSTRAVIAALYNRLPANGSEIVLYDINRTAEFGPLISAASETVLGQILPAPPRRYTTTLLTNAAPTSYQMAQVTLPAGAENEEVALLDASYPRDIYSLGHVAIPFPVHDGLYGRDPDPAEDFGITLGNVDVRGELGVLILNLEQFSRITFNPFFGDLIARVMRGVAPTPAGPVPSDI